MKKLLCLLFSGIILISFCTCNINSIERVSVEETEERFNEIVTEIKKYIKDNNIILYQEPFVLFENGIGYIDFVFNDGKIRLDINIHNDRFNLFGDDYENGVEKYNIEYTRDFNKINDFLNTDNEAFEIISVVLSNVLRKDISKAEIAEFMNQIKNNYCNSIPDNEEAGNYVDFESKFEDKPFRYMLGRITTGLLCRESIYFYGRAK